MVKGRLPLGARILIILGILVGILLAVSLIYTIFFWNPSNPYGWKSVGEVTDPQFRQILSYNFTNGLKRLTWVEEANGAWKVTNGSKVLYERWLKTVYGYESELLSEEIFKVYLEGVSSETFESYLKEVDKEVSEKIDYGGAWYSLKWSDTGLTDQHNGEAYIVFPDKKLGIYLIFFSNTPKSLSKQEAEKVIKELIDHVTSL